VTSDKIIDSELIFRPATVDDYAFVHSLSQENMKDLVTKHWGSWNEAIFKSSFNADNITIISYGQELVGFFDWSAINFGRAYLHNIQFKSVYQGQGIGSFVLEIIEQAARQRGLREISLKVFADSAAYNFYKANGYIVLNSDDDQIEMVKEIIINQGDESSKKRQNNQAY